MAAYCGIKGMNTKNETHLRSLEQRRLSSSEEKGGFLKRAKTALGID